MGGTMKDQNYQIDKYAQDGYHITDGENGSVFATNVDGHSVILFADGTTKEASLTIEEIDEYAYKHYDQGGDIVVECMEDEEKLDMFKTLASLEEWIYTQGEYRMEFQSVWE